jgi:hypothetical protein
MNVRTYQAYDINGYTFYTKEKDQRSKHQNSGVMMLSYADKEFTVNERFFGRIEEIWELNNCGEKMPMFRVRWAKNVEKEGWYFMVHSVDDQLGTPRVRCDEHNDKFFLSYETKV